MPLRIHREKNSQTFPDIHGLWYLSLFQVVCCMTHFNYQLISSLSWEAFWFQAGQVFDVDWIFNRLRKYYHRGGFFQDKAATGEEEPGISVRRGVKLKKHPALSLLIRARETLEFVQAAGHLAFLRLYLRDYHEPLEEEKCPFRDTWPIAV